MMRARAVFSLAVAAGLALALAACGSTPVATPTSTPTPTQAAEATGDGILRIGTIIPTSGNFAFLGPAQVAGVEAAVREINEAGGVNGAPVEVLHRDSGDAASGTAEASFADLVAQGVDVIVGPTSSAIAQRLVPLAIEAHVPLISPAATFTALSTIADPGYFYRTAPAYGLQGAALAEVLSEAGPKKIALLYANDDEGISLAETLTAGLEARGSELVVSEAFPRGTTDFAPFYAKVTEAAPDALVLASSYSAFDSTKALITQALGAGYGGAKLWLTTQNTGDYNQAFTPGTLAGVNGVIDGVEPDDAFKGRLKGIDGGLIQYRYSTESYDATMLAALSAIVAADDAGTAVAATLGDVSSGGIKCTSFAECTDVLKTQRDIDYDGLSGPVNFTPEGDVSSTYFGIYSYDGDNKFVLRRSIVAG